MADASGPLPTRIAPMMATLRDALPADGDTWGYEMKWDGVRAAVYVEDGRPLAVSRNDRDITASYPELLGVAEAMGQTRAVLDGELVAMDAEGRPSFERLQSRMHVGAPGPALLRSVPVTYLAFDVLHLDGRSTLDLPYEDRRRLLESMGLQGPTWRTPPAWFENGEAVLAAAREHGLEGVVAKRRDSIYRPGKRADTWIKVKNLRTQEVVVVGWTSGEGNRSGAIGALLVGLPGDDGLRYAGKVGTGFTQAALRELQAMLDPLRRDDPPVTDRLPAADARRATWVDPVVVGEVRFTEWTREGRLRHPAWRGLRPDKRAEDVVRES